MTLKRSAMTSRRLFCLFPLAFLLSSVSAEQRMLSAENLLVITAATDETDGFNRFMRTAREFNYTVKVTHTHTRVPASFIQTQNFN
ncbi:hypothetical protein LDENG_00010840 [Lucifuga dentata]|nr:hypothetical protein LDENG_00010840 [Lucifuga dentata]